MAKRHERTLARRGALQVLYQSEIIGVPADKVIEDGLVPAEAMSDGYARTLVLGAVAHASEIDGLIGSCSRNWALDRMPVVDRSILRLAVFEMRYVDDVPVSVSINEAVELAKEFGGDDDSHRFVNGILGRLARDFEVVEAGVLLEEGMEDMKITPPTASLDEEASGVPAEADGVDGGVVEPAIDETVAALEADAEESEPVDMGLAAAAAAAAATFNRKSR